MTHDLILIHVHYSYNNNFHNYNNVIWRAMEIINALYRAETCHSILYLEAQAVCTKPSTI